MIGVRVASSVLLAIGCLAAVACRTPPAQPAEPHDPAPPIDAAVAPIDAPVSTTPAPITTAECEQLVDHTLAVGMAEQRATKPADYLPTEEQLAKVRQSLLAMRPCDHLTRAQWECAMKADGQGPMYGCAE